MVEGPLQLRPPSVDIEGLAFALQGETLRATVAVGAPDPLHRCRLVVTAQYADAAAVARVVAVGDEEGATDGSAGGPAAEEGAVVEVACVEGSSRMLVDLTLPCEGEVTVGAVLTYCTSKVRVAA